MVRRYLLPILILTFLVLLFFGEEVWQFLSGDPIRDVQDWAQDIIRGFNRFISG